MPHHAAFHLGFHCQNICLPVLRTKMVDDIRSKRLFICIYALQIRGKQEKDIPHAMYLIHVRFQKGPA